MGEPDRVTDLLAELVELESPSGDDDRLEALAARMADLLREAGVDEVDIRPGGHTVARVPGDGPAVLVLGHLDTVWPAGRLESMPFRVEEGFASGPGAFDMKAGLVSLLVALRRLHRSKQSAAIRIVLTADEEIGSPVGAAIVAEQMVDVEAVLALEPPLDNGTLKVGRRGVARVRLAVTGREAHAGLDAAHGVSATAELVDQLARITSALPADEHRSVNIGTLTGGTRANVVAGAAAAELGLRFATAAAEEEVFALLDGLVPLRDRAGVDYELLSHRPAWEPHASAALSRHVRTIAAELGESVTAAVSPGGGDANLTGSRGIPTVDGLGPRGRGAHSVHETVELASIPARGHLLAELLTRPLPSRVRRPG